MALLWGDPPPDRVADPNQMVMLWKLTGQQWFHN